MELSILIVGFLLFSVINVFIMNYLLEKHSKTILSNITKIFVLRGEIKALDESLKKVHKRIDKIFVFESDKPAPNQAMESSEEGVELHENTPINLPNDIKFEVEGGDSSIPPGYQSKN